MAWQEVNIEVWILYKIAKWLCGANTGDRQCNGSTIAKLLDDIYVDRNWIG